jgi:3-oxoacyl-[acyl-carrier protein] reductase
MKKIMVITGTSKGIGKSLSEYFLKKGFTVIGCSRSATDLINDNYEHFYLDVSDEKSVQKMIDAVSKKHKKIDYLINNAGIASMNHTLLTPASIVEKILKINVLGTFLFSREVAKVMYKNKWGRIINFSTVGVPFRLEGECIYTSSKASIEMMTRIMAKEYADMNITVNAIGPTPIKTDLIKSIPKDKINSLINRQAIKQLSDYKDVANVIEFFINNKSKMITGQVVYLGGVS